MKIQLVSDSKINEEDYKMLKCNFCCDSSPKGKCRWSSEAIRADHCKVAITTMLKVLR